MISRNGRKEEGSENTQLKHICTKDLQGTELSWVTYLS
jgi:hypothetical protein